MAGVKVTLIRFDSSGMFPAERLFEAAESWGFYFERNISTLHIMKKNETAEDGSFTRTTIAEFPASGIESVEFV